MKKTIIALATLIASTASAQAATATVQPQACGTGSGVAALCYNLQNDKGLAISSLSISNTLGRVTMVINGIQFDSGLYQAPNNLPSASHVVLRSAAGAAIDVSYDMSYYITTVRSGRGQSSTYHWSLVGAQVNF